MCTGFSEVREGILDTEEWIEGVEGND